MEQKTYKGWDVYGNEYEYDEVKVIAMLHAELMRRDWFCDWEDVMRVGHTIYHIWDSQFEVDPLNPTEEWMRTKDRTEQAYVQAWFSRTIDDFMNFYQHILNYKEEE